MTERRFTWLHLTDLHVGQEPEDWLWPGMKTRVYDDLKDMLKKIGPVHAVFFTGDLTQKGAETEFAKAEGIVEDLLLFLKTQTGHSPMFYAVPGNHDLARPSSQSFRADPALVALAGWQTNKTLQSSFWLEFGRDLRRPLFEAFHGWSGFALGDLICEGVQDKREGFLPGDFAATHVLDGLRIGVFGLNTAALQLSGGDYRERLVLHPSQTAKLFPEGLLEWSRSHDACFLMTHHPPCWLDDASRAHLESEIAPADAVQLHLCGHQHEPEDVE